MLKLSLLGEIIVRLDDQPISHFASKKELALLAYLTHTGQTHNREALADLLWEARSTKQSLSNLRTIIARLRKRAGDPLIVTRKTVGIDTAVHEQTDSLRFEALLVGVGEVRSVTAVNLLTQGLALYSGEFMADFYLPETPRFNDWLVVEQERLRQIAVRGFQQLAGWQEEQGAFARGVITAQRWVKLDPLDEMAQQRLMRLLTFAGRIAEATAVYETYQQLLQTELAMPPTAATTALYEAIQAGSLTPPAPLPQHNLPRALTPLYGRQKEIEQLTRSLQDPDYPLISITGVGGMGKTSLALAAGRQLLAEEQHPFKDGIWFVPLEEIENDAPEKVGNRVAVLIGQAMGLYFYGQGNLWSQLLTQLAAKHLLLILDNIEQFLTVASDLIMALLKAGDNVHLLVTSRTTLALNAATALPLSGLETPTQVSTAALHNESVRLFAAKAAQIPTPFQLEKHLAEVVTICQFVEGMPLGIELAAASLNRLMITEIVPALTNNLKLIETNQRDLPPRQRTLQAVFDYSWHLLTSEEQHILAQISIFRDGFTRQAAEAVLQDRISSLFNLLDHALLTRNELGRFRMHPLLRQLAREKLNDPDMIGLQAQTLNRHARYFAEFMQSYEKDLQLGVSQAELQAILPELANLFAAWQHAVETEQWQIIANCLDSFHYYYKRKSLFSEEAVLVDVAISTLQDTMETGNVFLTSLLSRLMIMRAWGYFNSGQYEYGVVIAEQACKLAQRVNNPDIEGQARFEWAAILYAQDKPKLSLAQVEIVVALAKTAQNQILEADGWIGIGSNMNWEADVETWQEPLQHALKLCQTLQYKIGEMYTLKSLGFWRGVRLPLTEPTDYLERALTLSQLLGDVDTEAEILGYLGSILSRRGDSVGAQAYFKEGLAMFRQLNMPVEKYWMLLELGRAMTQSGDYVKAEKQLNESLAIAMDFDIRRQMEVKLWLGIMWSARGEADKANSYLTESFQITEQLQKTAFQTVVLYYWGVVLLDQTDWARAEQKLQQAHRIRQANGQLEATQLGQATLAGLAFVAFQQKKLDKAATHAEQLWQLWQASPGWAKRADLKVYWMLGMVLDGLGDSRANEVWQKAHALLRERSEKIPNEAARQMFLEQVPAHRAIKNITFSS